MSRSLSTVFPRATRRHFFWQAAAAGLAAGQAPSSLLRGAWTARWIAVRDAPAYDYGVYHFRRTFDLAAKPGRFIAHVSADNRYQLFVNGRRVSWGPARGDLFHWRFETLDLAPYLQTGKNTLAAIIWNFADQAPQAQITLRTGFLMQGDSQAERVVDTGAEWKCALSDAYSPIAAASQVRGYWAAGLANQVDGRKYLWGWETGDFDDSAWRPAVAIGNAAGREASDSPSRWMLVERTIPAMEEQPQRLQKLRRVSGIPQPAGFPAAPSPVTIPPQTRATLLLDQTHLTTAYPELIVTGGRDAVVRMRYAESLYVAPASGGRSSEKGNRDDVDGKQFVGYYDEFTADGGARRTFRPLWWRTYRYLELDVQTKDQALAIDDLRATYVGFPFERRARFDAATPDIQKMLDVGWRTARLCAHETYMDCPYYEQLQYGGDTRVQGLISLFNAGDGRLLRNAIDLLNDSRQSEGCPMSRYPTRLEQYIPAFAPWWIAMVHDYFWYVDDPAFVRRMLPGVRAVLSFFAGFQKENGSLGPLPWWRFMDWTPKWQGGNPPQASDGSSAPFDFLLLLAFGWAAEMEDALGIRAEADLCREKRRQLLATAQSLYWDPEKKMYADTPARNQFSQHANILAVLAGAIEGQAARDLMARIQTAPELATAGLFFRFYMHQALAMAGEGDGYLEQLDDWRKMIANGLTTFAENVESPGAPSRSDCHAWSASPNIEIFRTVLGVDSAAPGFRRVSVRPHLGKLPFVAGSVPHPKGSVDVRVEPAGQTWRISVQLPAGTPGVFEWRGTRKDLAPGSNDFTV